MHPTDEKNEFSTTKSTTTLQRLKDLYLKVLLACVIFSTTAMAVLSNVPPTNTSVMATFANLLLAVSAVTTSFIAIITIMLSFVFHDFGILLCGSRVVAWIPVFLLDCAFIQLIVGLVLWFLDTHAWQFAAVVALWSGLLFLMTLGIAGWIAVGTDSFTFLGIR
ncbi:hypothetical protein CGGC5_v016923 [Colletotrichum fructicola Nara gc5]|uniref:Uncharacterized protein n=1 Tax=Colletotrichum fructicola (strain Nara gc5) TaxID=1213859 RepID=A0A7J6ICE9_COLFN|nr:hypothetical protein CGGC5_v016923 [Colletotrichum fructicola Nara gc5]